jgi:hypothetical protein
MRCTLPILFVAALLGVSGCDQSETTRAIKPVAKTPTTTTAPATQTAKGPVIQMQIGGEPCDFPLARLRFSQKDGVISADLFSNDPKEAIDDNYAGNSFYLVMTFEGEDPRALGSVTWPYKAASGTRAETTTGLFLNGTKFRLQPYEVVVQLVPVGASMDVTIQGQFLRFDTRQDGLPTPVAVEARFKAAVEYK